LVKEITEVEVILKTARLILLLALILLTFLMVISCQSSEPNLDSIPLERALSNGKPTLAEFGRGVCVPCKAMKPILEELSVEYKGRLNVVIVEIDDHLNLTRQYEIMVIPTQIFFNSSGKEVFRHIGFYAKDDIIAQLKEMGIE